MSDPAKTGSCEECGSPLGEGEHECPECGAIVNDDRYCLTCGRAEDECCGGEECEERRGNHS